MGIKTSDRYCDEPRAVFDRTKTYGTFLSSHKSGRWSRISSGSVSAARTMNSDCPRLRVLVAAIEKVKMDRRMSEVWGVWKRVGVRTMRDKKAC
jgi:hypothetical protein